MDKVATPALADLDEVFELDKLASTIRTWVSLHAVFSRISRRVQWRVLPLAKGSSCAHASSIASIRLDAGHRSSVLCSSTSRMMRVHAGNVLAGHLDVLERLAVDVLGALDWPLVLMHQRHAR